MQHARRNMVEQYGAISVPLFYLLQISQLQRQEVQESSGMQRVVLLKGTDVWEEPAVSVSKMGQQHSTNDYIM
jgi:hypothetical protein